MEIILIAAMAANRVIGAANDIPWHIPGEQKRFKEITMGHALIMGRKTYDSIGRPLPGRRNIVISRNQKLVIPGCEMAHSWEDALDLCREERKVFNIGGEKIFTLGLDQADTIILSILDDHWVGDVYFPEFSEEDFKLSTSRRIAASAPYTIKTFVRRLKNRDLRQK